MGRDRILQVVDVINEDAVEFVHLRVNVTRDGDVNEEHGAVFPPRQKHFAVLALEDGDGGSGRGDHDVGAVAVLIEMVEANGFSTEACGEGNGRIVGAVGDEDGTRSLCQQMPGSQLRHFAGAYQAHVLAFERSEDFARQLDCNRRNRN